MPHSNLKGIFKSFKPGLMKCPCGQTFIYNSDRDQEMKMQSHKTVCPNPREGLRQL